MGDSYASGIGAGTSFLSYDYTCYRYNGAYGPQVQDALNPKPPKFNDVACSAEMFDQIIANQFADTSKEFGIRPAWGDKPDFISISMGGNDIEFVPLVTRCVYNSRVFTRKSCNETITDSQSKVHSSAFIDGAGRVINKAISEANKRQVGPSFKVFVLGYSQFFNEETTQCNDATLPRPVGTGAKLTADLRRTLNGLARDLNAALLTAAQRFNTTGQVFFVDWESKFVGHRFCDRTEPNPQDPLTWFFTFYSDDEQTEAFFKSIPRLYDLFTDKSNDPVTEQEYLKLIGDAAGNDQTKLSIGVDWFRVFHPKSIGHSAIRDVLQDAVVKYAKASANSSATTPSAIMSSSAVGIPRGSPAVA